MTLRREIKADAEDALQDLMLDVWMRGSHWHEGRIVLHLKSILRNQRRAGAARAAREALYASTQRGESAAAAPHNTRIAGHPSRGPISCAKVAKSRRPQTVYQTESPKRGTIIRKAVSTGSVVPRQEVAIKPRVSGIVEAIGVVAGQKVREGDLIARIRLVPDMVRLNDARSRVERARIALSAADQDHQRKIRNVEQRRVGRSHRVNTATCDTGPRSG